MTLNQIINLVDLSVLYALMLRVMIPLIFTWEVLWIVDDRVNKANIFFAFYKSSFY